jgi:hypothetical protein
MVQAGCKEMLYVRHLHKMGWHVVPMLWIHVTKQTEKQPVQAEIQQKYVTLREFWTFLDYA